MSQQELRAVPPRRDPAVLTVDAGSTGALSTRFLTLVVRTHPARCRARDPRPARPAADGLRAAS